DLCQTAQIGVVILILERQPAGPAASPSEGVGGIVERLRTLVFPNSSELRIGSRRVAIELDLQVRIRHGILADRVLGRSRVFPRLAEEQGWPVVLRRVRRGPLLSESAAHNP